MELFGTKCGCGVVIAEPFATMRLNRWTVSVDGRLVHDCRHVLLDDAARLRRQAHELQDRAASMHVDVVDARLLHPSTTLASPPT